MPSDSKIPRISLMQYAVMALPLGFSGFPLYLLAPDFYALNYGMTLSSLGICLLLIRVFDAFQDPFIGIMSDRYRERTLLVMGISAFVLVFSIYALFNVVLLDPFYQFLLFMSLSVTAFSILTINLNAVGGLWYEQEKSQVKVSSVRETFALIGLLISVTLPYFLGKFIVKEQVYVWFVMILAFFMVLGFSQFYLWYQKYSKKFQNNCSDTALKMVSFSKKYKKFLCLYFFNMLASSIPAVLVIFFVRDLLGVEKYTGLFLLVYFLSAALFMPLWTLISNKEGKYKAWFISMLMATFSLIWAFFLTKGDVWQYSVICFMSGIALGGDLVFPPAIVSDHIHQSKDQQKASAYYGILNLLSKSSLAFASALSFFILDYAQFKVGANNLSSSLMGLSIAYALVPCIIKVISAVFLWKFFIKDGSKDI